MDFKLLNIIYTLPFGSFLVGKIFNVFECLRLHLFDLKYSKNKEYGEILLQFKISVTVMVNYDIIIT